MPYQNRLRRDNLSRIFETLWRFPGLSRAELARKLRLDRSTTGQLADSLIEAGVLRQHQDELSGPRGGRPPVRLHVRSGYGFAIGAELTYPHVRLVAMDLSGDMLEYREVPVKQEFLPALESVLEAIQRLSDSVGTSAPSTHGLIAVGVGASAVVDTDAGMIVRSDALHMSEQVSIADQVIAGSAVPITVLNDAQASAIGEIHEHKENDLLLALIEFRPGDAPEDIGVGVGLVVDGRLRHGHAVTHMVRPEPSQKPWNTPHFVDAVSRGLALIANATGIRHVVLAGNAKEVFDPIADSVRRYAAGPDRRPTKLHVSHTTHGLRSVAIGASYAAVDHLFRGHKVPITSAIHGVER